MRISKLLNHSVSLLAVLAAVITWQYLQNFSPSQQEQNSIPSPPLSVLALDALNHPRTNVRNLPRSHSWDSFICAPSEPNGSATVTTPFEEQISDFPDALVLEETEVDGPEPNQTTKIKILQTDFKYPLIRSEEIVDNDTGNVVEQQEMAADHLLVSVPPGKDPMAFLSGLGSRVTSITPITRDGSSYIAQLASPSIASLPQALDIVAGRQIIVEPDIVHHIPTVAHTAWSNANWGLDEIAGELTPFTAPSKQSTTSSKVVAVIDTGILPTHQELEPNMWHNHHATKGDIYGWNAVDNNGDIRDDNGHGTFCAGIIGAVGNNNMGFVGVVPRVRLMACKAFNKHGVGIVSDEIKCIDYACDHGAKVLNCSWGGGPSQLLYEALRRAEKAEVICVAAAGNDGTDGKNFYPAAYGNDTSEGQKLDNVISVAASTETDELAPFSNYGNVHLAAPGADICSAFNDGDDSYAIGSGTSMAAPYVTGAVVLLETQFPYHAVINRLFNTADKVPGLTGKVIFGRLNIAKALTQ
ncbi:MAG: S8 family serine peptidase [Chthoniobacterales bacterium]|nr:S8 family serine peptidase [Chthoniobacterales bacterium]